MLKNIAKLWLHADDSASLGIDLGTSGIRSAVVDASGNVLATARADYGKIDPDQIDALFWGKGVVNCWKD